MAATDQHQALVLPVEPSRQPGDADRLGLADGARARVSSESGSLEVPVEVSDPTAGATWFDDPTLVAAGLVADYEHPTYGRFRQYGHLVHLSDTPGRIGGPPPLLGEHSAQVLAELGFTAEQIVDFAARRITVLAEGSEVS